MSETRKCHFCGEEYQWPLIHHCVEEARQREQEARQRQREWEARQREREAFVNSSYYRKCDKCNLNYWYGELHICPEMRYRVSEDTAKTLNDVPPTPDNVNNPAHYTAGKVECIDALEAATAELGGIEAVCTANAIKYLWRWKRKGGKEDLRKARWYINRLLGEND